MSFLFKSKKEREKETRKERRQAFRRAENAVDSVKDRIKSMQKESATQWEQAREALKSGQKAAAQRALTGYRASQVLMTKLEQKRWVFEQYLSKMEVAQSDNEFAAALAGINKIVNIDPEHVADVFEESQEILGEAVDSERFWSRLYEKEMEGATGSLEDHIPNMDELSSQLEQEVAAEVSGSGKSPAPRSTELDQRIQSGQERVRKLLGEKQGG